MGETPGRFGSLESRVETVASRRDVNRAAWWGTCSYRRVLRKSHYTYSTYCRYFIPSDRGAPRTGQLPQHSTCGGGVSCIGNTAPSAAAMADRLRGFPQRPSKNFKPAVYRSAMLNLRYSSGGAVVPLDEHFSPRPPLTDREPCSVPGHSAAGSLVSAKKTLLFPSWARRCRLLSRIAYMRVV